MEPTNEQESNKAARTPRTWLVIEVGGKCRIGCAPRSKDEVLQIHDRGGCLNLEDVFELYCQTGAELVPNSTTGRPERRISKELLTLRPDATLYQMNSYISLMGAFVYYLDDLKGTDITVYKEQLEQAVAMAHAWQKERARQTSGLVVTPNMPNAGLSNDFGVDGRRA